MNKIAKKLTASIVAFLLMLSAFVGLFQTASKAWLGQRNLSPTTGSVVSGYFAGGKGTAEEPYRITAPIHLYNLAWLQNTGRFNVLLPGQNVYQQFHFVLEADLDMSEFILPPIGTIDNPFVGTFTSRDENVYTVSNLTVSNMLGEGEIEKRPQYVTELNGAEIIGMFGVVGNYSGIDVPYSSLIPSISNFRLENATVRAITKNALAGLVCGYASGTLRNVRVEGGTIISGASNTSGLTAGSNTLSRYALVGDISSEVFWDGVTNAPGMGDEGGNEDGGVINIFPFDTDTKNAIDQLDDTSTVTAIQVPGSATDKAFFVGNSSSFTVKPGQGSSISAAYRYSQIITSTTGTQEHAVNTSRDITVNHNANNTTSANLGEYQLNDGTTLPAFPDDVAQTIMQAVGSKPNVLTFDGIITKPSAQNTVTVGNGWIEKTLTNGTNQVLPSNTIWFKPIAAGICNFAFYVGNMSGNRYKSIYRYKSEKIEGTNQYRITDWSETVIVFDKQSGNLSNGNLVCYQYEIKADDLGYEFAIGTTGTTKDNAYFLLLSLAGSNDTGAGEGGEGETTQVPEISVNFVPVGYTGAIIDIGMIISTFDIRIVKNGANAAASVTFQRTLPMTANNTTATVNGLLAVESKPYVIPDPEEETS